MTVTYPDRDGRHQVVVHMLTEPARVPLLGSPMVVLTDNGDSVHVEMGNEAELRFEENYQRFLPSEG